MQEEKIPRHLIVIALVLVVGALPPILDATIVNIAVDEIGTRAVCDRNCLSESGTSPHQRRPRLPRLGAGQLDN